MFLNDDATHTYRGYRLQALYILWRILLNDDASQVFQPEGKEDLAVYDSENQLLEISQIKAYGSELTLSDLKPNKANSFFYRVHQHIESHAGIQVQLVNFGRFGQTIHQAFVQDGSDRLQESSKLAGYGFLNTSEAKRLFGIITPNEVQETVLYKEVINKIRTSLMVDPDAALDLLMYWIYLCSEQKSKITFHDLEQKILGVGKFILERAKYHQEWFATIEPIIDHIPVETTDKLKDEFYRGVSAKYEHILADLDVVRSQKLEQIHQAFQRSQVVIVHGVSGQGKTTLAFRFLHDYVGHQFRFYVHSPEDRHHALNIARAISGQAEVMDTPIILYIDVRPSETNWTDTVRQLVRLPNIYILVTIREDDLRRAQFDDTEFSFETIELSLGRDEANEIYNILSEQKQSPNFTDFDDVWRKFTSDRNTSPLMEFVYLLTQGESLRTRLKKQIRILEDEVLANKFEESLLVLLRIVAIASAYGARLNRRILQEQLELKVPRRVFEKLEKEYLIRTEDTLVDGVHPVRSQILQELLADEFTSWEKDILVLLTCLHEPDLGFFLLNLFVSKPNLSQTAVTHLSAYKPQTWDGIAGILRALVWLGICNFVNVNEVILRQAFEKFGIGALMFLNSDLLGAVQNSQLDLENLAKTNSAIAKAMIPAKTLSTQMQGANEVLALAQNWLIAYIKSTPVIEVASKRITLPEIIFWCRHFEVNELDNVWMPTISDRMQLDQLSIAELADLSLALSYKQGVTSWHEQQSDYLLQRFMYDTLTFAIEKDDPLIPKLHFILDFEIAEDKKDKDEAEQRNFINNEAVKRVRYFMYLFPEYEKVGSQGYGHRVHDLDIHDESYKSGIPRSAFPMKWLVWGNSIYNGLFYWLVRDNDWLILAEKTINLRKKIMKTLSQYEREVDRYFSSRKAYNLFEKLAKKHIQDMVQTLTASQLLPRVSVDPWGFTTESEQKGLESKIVRPQGILIEVLKPYWSGIRKYIGALQNFFSQSQYPLMITSADLRITMPEVVSKLYQMSGSNAQHLGRLSIHNLNDAMHSLKRVQIEFRSLMENFVNPSTLELLEINERETIENLYSLWCYFIFEPFQIERRARRRFIEAMKNQVQQIEQRTIEAFQLVLPQAQIELLNQSILFDDRSYRVLVLNEIDGLTLYSTINEQLPQILHSIFQTIERWSPEFYAVEQRMPHLLIILVVEGQLLLPIAYRIMPTMFVLQSAPKPINFVPLAIPDEVMAQLNPLGIELHSTREAILSKELFLNYAILHSLAAHMVDILQASQLQKSYIGQDIIVRYYGKWLAYIKEVIEKLLEIIAEIDGFIRDLNFESQDTKGLMMRVFGIVLSHQDLLNSILSEDKMLDLRDLQEWQEMMKKMLDYLFALQVYITKAAQLDASSSET